MGVQDMYERAAFAKYWSWVSANAQVLPRPDQNWESITFLVQAVCDEVSKAQQELPELCKAPKGGPIWLYWMGVVDEFLVIILVLGSLFCCAYHFCVQRWPREGREALVVP